MKPLTLLCLLLLTGCQEQLGPEPIQIVGPTLEPLQQGLTLLGVALVLNALIRAISDHWPRVDAPAETEKPNQKEEDR